MCQPQSDVGSSHLPQVWKLETSPCYLNRSALWRRHGKQTFLPGYARLTRAPLSQAAKAVHPVLAANTRHTQGLPGKVSSMCIASPMCLVSIRLIACGLYSYAQTFMPGQWQEDILQLNFCFPLPPDLNKCYPLTDFHLALKTDV